MAKYALCEVQVLRIEIPFYDKKPSIIGIKRIIQATRPAGNECVTYWRCGVTDGGSDVVDQCQSVQPFKLWTVCSSIEGCGRI